MEKRKFDLDQLSQLARIELTQSEKADFQKELSEMFELIENIAKAVDKPVSASEVHVTHVLRADRVSEFRFPELIIRAFPKTKAKLLLVPKLTFRK